MTAPILNVSLRDERNIIQHEFDAESIAPFSGNTVNIRYADGTMDLFHIPEGWTLALSEGAPKDAVE